MTKIDAFTGFTINAPVNDLETGAVYIGTLIGFKPFQYTEGDETRDLVEWQFNTEDGTPVSGTTTTATGPKSKAFRWLSALMGAANVKPGATFSPADLIGREAQLLIGENKNGYPKVDDVTPLPKGR